MSADVTPYLDLITSEHQDKPKFIATVTATVQGNADLIAVLRSMPGLFDLDAAVGDQLDIVGRWVNRNRFAPGALTDDAYRTLLRATIAANHWDGTIEGAYQAWDTLFATSGLTVLIIDNQDMTMDLALVGIVPDADTIALLTGGFLNLKPATVRIAGYYYPTATGPLFGFDIENEFVAGFDTGSWATFVPA